MTDPEACPACGGPLRPWRSVQAGEPSDPRAYPLSRCERCGTAVTGGEPSGPEAYEEGVYAPDPPRALPIVWVLQRATGGQPARLLRKAGVPSGSRVLDAGAGRGRLVGGLRRRGYDAVGIEPSARGADAAAAAGLPVSRASLAEHEDESLEAVVLWHVLEHLDEPREALERIRSWLRPGGVLLVGVPNLASLQARVAGAGWFHHDAPRHRMHLTPGGLGALLGRSGLQPGPATQLTWDLGPTGMWMALMSRAGGTPAFPFHLLKRNVEPNARDMLLLAAGVPLAPVAVLLEAGAAAAGRGGTIAQVARRP